MLNNRTKKIFLKNTDDDHI